MHIHEVNSCIKPLKRQHENSKTYNDPPPFPTLNAFLVLGPFALQLRRLGHIPNPSQALIPACPCCQIGFHTVLGPSLLPWRCSCHLSVSWWGCTQLVMAQNRMVGEFRWEWESTTASLWEDEQLTRKISRLYTNVAYCVLEADRVPFRGVTAGRDPGSECVGKAWRWSTGSFRYVDRVVPQRLSM